MTKYYQCPECGTVCPDTFLSGNDPGMFCECGQNVWFQPSTGRIEMVPCDPPPIKRETFNRQELMDAFTAGFQLSIGGFAPAELDKALLMYMDALDN